MDKTELIEEMKVSLSTVFSFYLKAHNYHWNVTGPNFAQYHNFFGTLYEEVHDSVDLFAEEIRKLGNFAPGSLSRFSELTLIDDEVTIPEAQIMFTRLFRDNDVLLKQLYVSFKLANDANEQGTADFLAGRIGYHEKLRWMLKSF